MKRFGKKAILEALEQGATIRSYASYSVYGSCYRVVMNNEIIGYITCDLHTEIHDDLIADRAPWEYVEFSLRDFDGFVDSLPENVRNNVCDEVLREIYANATTTQWAEKNAAEYAETVLRERAEEATKEAATTAEEEKTAEEWNAESERVRAAVLASLPETVEAEPEETERERTDRENREHCKRIAEELEQYTDGNVYRCTECGELCTIEEAEDEDGFTVYKTSCGCTLDYEPDQMSLYDFIADTLDVEVSCSLDREYHSARIMVACGGPNIYIDTARKAVELYWWTDRAEYPISSSAADALDETIEEIWGCR